MEEGAEDGGMRRTRNLLAACHEAAPDEGLMVRALSALLTMSDKDFVVQLLLTLRRDGVAVEDLPAEAREALAALCLRVCRLDADALVALAAFEDRWGPSSMHVRKPPVKADAASPEANRHDGCPHGPIHPPSSTETASAPAKIQDNSGINPLSCMGPTSSVSAAFVAVALPAAAEASDETPASPTSQLPVPLPLTTTRAAAGAARRPQASLPSCAPAAAWRPPLPRPASAASQGPQQCRSAADHIPAGLWLRPGSGQCGAADGAAAATAPTGRPYALVLRLAAAAGTKDVLGEAWRHFAAAGIHEQPPDLLYIFQAPLHCDLSTMLKLEPPEPEPHQVHFLAAAAAAMKGDHAGPKFGAALVVGGERVAVGWNHKYRTANGKRGQKVMHAEVHCLAQHPRPAALVGATVWIVQVDAHGAGYGSGYPCPACTQALCRLGVTDVRYSNGTRVSSLRLPHQPDSPSPTYDLARIALQTDCPDGSP